MIEPECDEPKDLYRRKPLLAVPARGRLLIPAAVANRTCEALKTFRGSDGPHEGIVLWAGRKVEDGLLVASAIVPRADHGCGRVHIDRSAVGASVRVVRSFGLIIVAQVHSHPGDDTRHSDGDDHMILLPHEGMFSVVVGRYGESGISPEEGAGFHQFQDTRWVAVSDAARSILIVPTSIEL